MAIINKKRMIKNFMDMARIPSLSLREKEMANFVIEKFKPFCQKIEYDDSAKKINGNCSNLILRVKAGKNKTSIFNPFLLSAHLDTVGPADKINPILKKDRIITDGKTVLGADCKAAISIILEVLHILKEKKIDHPEIEILFTVSEEMGLLGSKNLNFSKIKSKYGIILDNEQNIENLILKAPGANSIKIEVYGIASHSGVEPEKGLSAIKIISEIISQIEIGRVDIETTQNIGLIEGGEGVNIIAPKAMAVGEIRSLSKDKIKMQIKKIEEIVNRIQKRYKKAHIKFYSQEKFPSLNIKDEKIVKLIKNSMSKFNIKMKDGISGGGTDANILNSKGIITPILATGMRDVHTTKEYLNLNEFFKSSLILLDIIKSVQAEGLNGNK
jgi:tripeptide aminopeptidase